MRVVAIIPARYASTRFPGKPLVDILGKPMIQHVYERTSEANLVDRVVVATDDSRIFSVVEGFGGEVVMTRSDHETGTDRLAEVARDLDCEWVVNVQGDEPIIEPRMIDEAVTPLLEDDEVPMGTLMTLISDVEDYLSPNVVKVVASQDGFALYFSRSPIPFPRDFADNLKDNLSALSAFKHVGLYVYRREFLLAYPGLPSTPLEKLESLEQLRALENGYPIRVVETSHSSRGVDVPEDLQAVRDILLGEVQK